MSFKVGSGRTLIDMNQDRGQLTYEGIQTPQIRVKLPTGNGDTDRQNVQEAIDALPDSGGSAILSDGTYIINKAPNENYGIRTRRGVHLEGQSTEGTILAAGEDGLTVLSIGMRSSILDYDLANAIEINPGDDIQTKVDDATTGDLFLIKSGIHREQKIMPQDYQVFIGEEGAMMCGARILTDWTFASGRYETTLDSTITMGLRNGECVGSSSVADSLANDYPCIHPEELFVSDTTGSNDSTWLEQVTSLGDLTTNKWFIDYTGSPQKVYTFDDWSSKVVELAVTPYAFGYDIPSDKTGAYSPDRTAGTPMPTDPSQVPDPYSPSDMYAYKPKGIVIKNLTVEKYANPASTGVIGYMRPGLDWTCEGNECRWNHASGIKAKGAFIIRGNNLHDNGIFGLEVGDGNTTSDRGGDMQEWGWYGGYGGNNGLIEGNIVKNNRKSEVGVKAAWGAGAMKISQTFNLIFRDNYVADNDGYGVWFDFAYAGNQIINNYVVNHTNAGILMEISETGSGNQLVECNYVKGNGKTATTAGDTDSNIWISNSPNVYVLQNQIIQDSTYGRGITISDYSYRNVEGEDVYSYGSRIYQNHITMTNGAGSYGICGGQTDRDKSTFFDFSTNQWKWNHYHVPDTSSNHWRWDKSPFSTYPPFTNWSGWVGTYEQDFNGWADTNTDYEAFFSNCPQYKKSSLSKLKVYGNDRTNITGIRAGQDEFFMALPPLFAECVKTEDCTRGWLIGAWGSELHNCQTVDCAQGIKMYDDPGTPPHTSTDVRPTNVCSAINCLVSGSTYGMIVHGIGNRIIGSNIVNITDGGTGIYIEDEESYSNYIAGNNIETETRWEDATGIRVGESTRNTIVGNTFGLHTDNNCIQYASDGTRVLNTVLGNYNRQNSTLLDQAVSGTLEVGGHLGIGTEDPSSYDANDFVIYTSSGNAGMTVATPTDAQGHIFFADGSSGTDAYMGNVSYDHFTDKMWFGTNATTHITIDSNGKVGIGTDGPDRKTHIRDSNDQVMRIESTTTTDLAIDVCVYNGSPDTNLTALRGSLCVDVANATLYINDSGSSPGDSGTSWTAV